MPQEYPTPDATRKTSGIQEWREDVYGLSDTGDADPRSRSRPNKVPRGKRGKEILDRQLNRCLYCRLEFGSVIYRGTKTIVVRLHWDHFIPRSYLQSDPRENFVAACSVCNGIKSNLMFDSVEIARAFIAEKWRKRKYSLTFKGLPYDLEDIDEEDLKVGKRVKPLDDSDRPSWHAYVYGGKR